MANADVPFGFKPVNGPTGGPPRLTQYKFSGEATAIYPGDMLILEGDGKVAVITASSEEPLLGVAANHVAASAAEDTAVYVYDDPNQWFVAQHDGTSTDDMAGDLHDPIATTGDTVTLQSLMEIDTAGSSASSIQLIKLFDAPDNIEGLNARWICKIAKHHFTSTLT